MGLLSRLLGRIIRQLTASDCMVRGRLPLGVGRGGMFIYLFARLSADYKGSLTLLIKG